MGYGRSVNRLLNTKHFKTKHNLKFKKSKTSSSFAGDLEKFHIIQLPGTTNCWNASKTLTKSEYFTTYINSLYG